MVDCETNELTAFRHEPIETNVRAVWRTGAAITAVVLATFALILGMMKWLEPAQRSAALDNQAMTDLNWAKQNPLQQLRAEEQKMLDSYEWVDRNRAIARIPVSRAIEISSENGLPALPIQAESDSAEAQPTPSSVNASEDVGGGER
jgi:hypothetical protein